MAIAGRSRRVRFLLGLFALWLVLVSFPVTVVARERISPPGTADAAAAGSSNSLLQEVREYLRRYYVDPLPAESLAKPTVEELIAGLNDPYTVYLGPQEYAEFLESLRGSFSGVGIRLDKVGDYITVVAPLPGSPAERAGVEAGDRVLAADGYSLVGASVEKALTLIRGEPGSAVVLTLERPGRGRFELKLVREVIRVPSVSWELLPEEIGYLRLEEFGTTTAEEVARALSELVPASRGIILDLRGNSGGLLDVAVEVAAQFVPSGPVVQVVDRQRQPEALEAEGGRWVKLPLVVLVDGWTASAAEIVAGAVQDYRTGLLVGERTYGKGSIQSVFELSNGGALKLSVARYRTPLGREVDRKGLEPDLPLADREEQETLARRLILESLRRGRTVWLAAEGADSTDTDTVYRLLAGRAYVPAEAFARLYGAFLEQTGSRVLLRYGPHEVNLKVSGTTAPGTAFKDGTGLWLPLRAVVEGLGGSVRWDGPTKRVEINF
ncbi:MAG: S41 family peptidase [Moorellales bacterium]